MGFLTLFGLQLVSVDEIARYVNAVNVWMRAKILRITYRESSWLCVYCVKTVVSREASRLLYIAGMSTL